ncbi:MAG: protein kinase [Acidobacteria bacterium]|nr:protein kinase [Acidobacteriota bacterium]
MAKLEKLIGQTLDGKYLLDKLLGQGGMGAVFLATHLGTKRPVALKVIAPQFMANEEVGERFRREAEAAGRLRHPNVVNVTDFGVTNLGKEPLAYLVMEYLDGHSLGDMLKEKGRLPLDFVVEIVEQICLAIGKAHQQGIIHRDLKPDNIWLQPDGRGGYLVKVLDFGLAKLRDVTAVDDSDEATRSNPFATPTRAILNDGRATVGAMKTTQPQYLNDGDREAETQIQLNASADRKASTQMQTPNSTELEAATLLQAPVPIEGDAATMIQPATTQLEEATLLQTPVLLEAEPRFKSSINTGEIKPSSSADKSSVTSSSAVELTRIGSILGTPLYMSPEQCRSEPLDPRSDIYSLGVIIYQMLAGAPPFSGTMMELMDQHCSVVPPALKAQRENIPASVSNLVMAALEKPPEKRPASAEIFANALRATAEGEADLLRQTKALYYSNQRLFFQASLVIYAPLAVLSIAASVLSNATIGKSVALTTSFYFVIFAVVLLATRWNAALCTLIIKEQRLQPTATIKLLPLLQIFIRRLPTLLITAMLAYAKAFFNLWRLVRPGWREYVDDALSASVVVMEGKRGAAALSRSQHLVNPLRALARAMAARDLGISVLSLILFPCITVIMTMLFGGGRGNVFAVMMVPVLRNFIVTYCWFLLTLMHTIYAAAPLAMLYFKARQASGEMLEENTSERWQFDEAQKRPDQMGKATVVWFSLPLVLLAFMLLTLLLDSGGSLIEAVRGGRIATVKRLLAAGANPNDKRFGSTSVLMLAARDGQLEAVNALLEAGAKVNDQDSDGDTPLLYAAMDNRVEIIQALLDAGANLNARNQQGQTALSRAAQRGRREAVQALLAKGADLHLKDQQGKSALQYAEEEDHKEIVQLLKAAGANDWRESLLR